jgi:hypothetical protein
MIARLSDAKFAKVESLRSCACSVGGLNRGLSVHRKAEARRGLRRQMQLERSAKRSRRLEMTVPDDLLSGVFPIGDAALFRDLRGFGVGFDVCGKGGQAQLLRDERRGVQSEQGDKRRVYQAHLL